MDYDKLRVWAEELGYKTLPCSPFYKNSGIRLFIDGMNVGFIEWDTYEKEFSFEWGKGVPTEFWIKYHIDPKKPPQNYKKIYFNESNFKTIMKDFLDMYRDAIAKGQIVGDVQDWPRIKKYFDQVSFMLFEQCSWDFLQDS
jgi:hypothetical protein